MNIVELGLVYGVEATPPQGDRAHDHDLGRLPARRLPERRGARCAARALSRTSRGRTSSWSGIRPGRRSACPKTRANSSAGNDPPERRLPRSAAGRGHAQPRIRHRRRAGAPRLRHRSAAPARAARPAHGRRVPRHRDQPGARGRAGLALGLRRAARRGPARASPGSSAAAVSCGGCAPWRRRPRARGRLRRRLAAPARTAQRLPRPRRVAACLSARRRRRARRRFISAATPAWLGFLVLTIAGERLELSRFMPPSPRAKNSVCGDLPGSVSWASCLRSWCRNPAGKPSPQLCSRSAVWLAAKDIARRTIRESGLTRYIAAALLSGYLWLAVGALIALSRAGVRARPSGLGRRAARLVPTQREDDNRRYILCGLQTDHKCQLISQQY